MSATSKRLEFLQKHTSSGSTDPFAWYGLAMEYRSLGRLPEAIATFKVLLEKSPDYVPMYLMYGQTYVELGHPEYAKAAFTAGIEVARKKGDTHTLGELEGALGALG